MSFDVRNEAWGLQAGRIMLTETVRPGGGCGHDNLSGLVGSPARAGSQGF